MNEPTNLPNSEIPQDTWTPPLPPDDGSPLAPLPTTEEFDADVLATCEV